MSCISCHWTRGVSVFFVTALDIPSAHPLLLLTSAGAGSQYKNINAVGFWLLFNGQFQEWWSEKTPGFRDISNSGILNDSHPLGSFSEPKLGLQNMCQSWVPGDGLELWGGRAQGWDFRAGKEVVHHRVSSRWCFLVLCILRDIKVPQPESSVQKREVV